MEEISEQSFSRTAAIGEVIVSARNVEARLHAAAGGEVTGIHALTELLGDKLPDELKRQLHYIATVRNQAAHEEEFQIDAAGLESFRKAAQEAEETLARLFPAGGAGDRDETPFDVAVEREALKHIAYKLHWMGYLPVIGVLNLFRIIFSCVWAQLKLVGLLVFYFAAIPMLIEGVRSYPDKNNLLYAGCVVAGAVYLIILVMSFFVKVPKLPKIIVWLPGIDVAYLFVLLFRRLAWGRLFVSLMGVMALVTSVYGAFHERWKLAGYALLAEWIFSVLASILFPPQDEEE